MSGSGRLLRAQPCTQQHGQNESHIASASHFMLWALCFEMANSKLKCACSQNISLGFFPLGFSQLCVFFFRSPLHNLPAGIIIWSCVSLLDHNMIKKLQLMHLGMPHCVHCQYLGPMCICETKEFESHGSQECRPTGIHNGRRGTACNL